MDKKPEKDRIDVVFNAPPTDSKGVAKDEHIEHGVSSLYGLVNDNMTYVNRCAYNRNADMNTFPRAYINLVKTFFKSLLIFWK
ncbi:hypothetical protein [Fundidesulfovibrio soli]|uniref:hypothetical protein n=1 Tax=Fundidesulfovibrio soli TaxID=2922716 RepID=UPI001FAF1CFC|nr:hypothetical protein [Fundidesulfovibrio soli]